MDEYAGCLEAERKVISPQSLYRIVTSESRVQKGRFDESSRYGQKASQEHTIYRLWYRGLWGLSFTWLFKQKTGCSLFRVPPNASGRQSLLFAIRDEKGPESSLSSCPQAIPLSKSTELDKFPLKQLWIFWGIPLSQPTQNTHASGTREGVSGFLILTGN